MSFNSNTQLKLQVLKLMYCGFSARVLDTDKVVYCAQYPAFNGTTKPNLNVASSEDELTADTHITVEEYIDFITSSDIRQANGNWKGGPWGTNNFTLTGGRWLSGLYVNDIIDITFTKEGIVKYNGQVFTDESMILPNTENSAWSCNALWQTVMHPLYITDNPMPQFATDTLFMWAKINPDNTLKNLLLKVMRRGEGPNVDCPRTIIPAGGEHLQPEHGTDKRQQALFTINEEIGLPIETINQCYFLNLGVFNDNGRDPRYWKYSMKVNNENHENNKIVESGVNRLSSTNANILLLMTYDDVEPKEVTPEDTNEINSKWWENVHDILTNHPDKDWMLKDHQKFIPASIQKVQEFLSLSPNEREVFKF
jgi:hypothetical protein